MGRHEDIKAHCVDILNYYSILADTEFTIPANQLRIDVVGHYKNMSAPDIGIEVEITSNFQHDASKLANLPHLKWRFIITEDEETLTMGEEQMVKGKIVWILSPPDKDVKFEEKIREITNTRTRNWFNANKRTVEIQENEHPEEIMHNFSKEIEAQELDIGIAKDVIFRAALGGIEVGYYKDEASGTTFHRTSEIPKEIHYLSARHLILEERIGYSYESGKHSTYILSEEGKEIAARVISERIKSKENLISELMGKYGKNAVFIALLGTMGKLIDDTSLMVETRLDPYTSLQLGGTARAPRYLVEKYDLDEKLFFMTQIIARTPQLTHLLVNIYKELVQCGAGNSTSGYTQKGRYYGEVYNLPLRNILEIIDVKSWLDSVNKDIFLAYCEWVILRSHNKSVPQTLYDSVTLIGSNSARISEMVSETFRAGITSKLLDGQSNTIAVYDENKFNEYCEIKMKELVPELLDNE